MEAGDRERMAEFLADLVEGSGLERLSHGTGSILEGRSPVPGTYEERRFKISVEDATVRILRGARSDSLSSLRRLDPFFPPTHWAEEFEPGPEAEPHRVLTAEENEEALSTMSDAERDRLTRKI